MIQDVTKKFKSSDVQSAVVISLPSYHEVRCQLSRHRSFRCTPVPDPLCLPDELRTTLRGRSLDDDDVNPNERFLMYTGQGGKLLVFCANTELTTIHQSEYLICDGTFEMSPDTAYQVYTVHGYIKGEGMPLLWALLPNKTTAMYIELFTSLHDALVEQFGDVGVEKTLLTDFELAAINAIRQSFPMATVKGCSFHFRQAILRRVQLEGLKAVYESQEPVNEGIRKWIRQIMAMTMLPVFSIPLTWNFLKFPPSTGQPDVDAKTLALAAYVERTWMNGDFHPSFWSHHDNLGPQTTNLAEGWHNGLNTHFGMPHPSLRTFLDWLQKCQYEIQCRELQLQAGRPPKQRLHTYVKLDENLMAAKVRYNLNVGGVFMTLFPNSNMWSAFQAAMLEYLDYVSYLVVGSNVAGLNAKLSLN